MIIGFNKIGIDINRFGSTILFDRDHAVDRAPHHACTRVRQDFTQLLREDFGNFAGGNLRMGQVISDFSQPTWRSVLFGEG